MTVHVRFADLRSVTRSVTLDAPISATAILAEIAEELVRTVLALHPDERSISLLPISVSHLEKDTVVQLELPLGLEDEGRRPGSKKGLARWAADHAVDKIRERFGWGGIWVGGLGNFPFRSGRVSSARRTGALTTRSDTFPTRTSAVHAGAAVPGSRGLTSSGTASVAA